MEVELHILTEDTSNDSETVHKLELGIGRVVFRFIGLIYRNVPYYYASKKLHKKHDFDLIWYNNAITGVLTARFLNVPTIGMINDYISATNNKSNFSFSKKWIRHYCFAFFEYLACKSQDKIIANSAYLKNILLSRYQVEADKLDILYKSVELIDTQRYDTYTISKNLSAKNTIDILFVKSNYIIGGLYDLIEAISMLPYTFNLHIVGGAEIELSSFLATIPIPDRIKFVVHGKLSNQAVLDLHRSVDIFCTPSVSEALGVANLEALSLGTPVVFRHVGGVSEVSDNGNNGFFDDKISVSSLANAINQCILNDDLRQRKVEAGKKYILNSFTADKMIKNFINISNTALNKA